MGRDPKNTFTVDTDLTPDPSTVPEQADPSPPGETSVRPDEVDQDNLQRNWRIGAENTAPDRTSPARHYADLYLLFRNDHAETARLVEQGMRSRAQLFANRAARRLTEMKPLLAADEHAPFEEVIARYRTYAEGVVDREGSLLRLSNHELSSGIAKRFSPESARLAPVE